MYMVQLSRSEQGNDGQNEWWNKEGTVKVNHWGLMTSIEAS